MKKNVLLSIFFSILAVLVNYGISFFLTPYITENVGIDAYGFVSIAKTFVGYASIVTIALTSFVVRFISVNYHKKDFVSANGYYSTSIVACVGISLAIFAFFAVLIWDLDSLINIPPALSSSVKILFALVLINFVITTIATPFGTSFYIKERIDISAIIKIIGYTVEAVLLVLLFSVLEPAIWFVGVGIISFSTVNILLSYAFTKKATPELSFAFRLVSLKKTKDLVGNGIWNSINQLGNTLHSGFDLIVSNLMLSARATGQIAVAKTLGTMAGAFEAMIYQSVQPSLLKSYSTDDLGTTFVSKTKKAMKICGLFCSLMFAGFFAIGREYYLLWLPKQNFEVLYWLTLLTLFSHVLDGFVSPLYYINTLTLKNKLPCWITIAGGLLNIFSMFILINYTTLGAFAVAGTTAVIMFLTNFVFNPIYSSKCINVSPKTFYPPLIKHLFSCALMCAVFYLIRVFILPTSWPALLLTILVMAFVGAALYLLINFKPTEIKDILGGILSRFKKKWTLN